MTVRFTDGTSASGNILVGADGARSKVREFLVGKEAARVDPLGILLYNTVVKYNDAEKARFIREHHPLYYVAMHPNGAVMWLSTHDIPDPERPETWAFQVMPSWLGTRDDNLTDAERLRFLKKEAQAMAEPWRSAIMWIPDDHKLGAANIGTWTTIPFTAFVGKATLAGDAAHPVPPRKPSSLSFSCTIQT